MTPTKKPSTAPQTKLSSLEFNSLHDFYNATHGPSWRWHNFPNNTVPWNFSIPNVNPCLDNWQGLQCTCSFTSCEVIIIFLDHHNLSGHLPDSIKNFPKMQTFILRGNHINGTIPDSIGNMTLLEELDLSVNNFSGEIPSSISNLGNMQILNLGMNLLSTIPRELYQLTNLQVLSLVENQFKGSLSRNIGNLTGLQTLQLQVNKFSQSIPKEICELHNLQSIDLSENSFNGTFPSCLFTMINLMSVTMFANHITGTLSEGIGNLTNLGSLDISRNKLYGSFPSSIGNLRNLIVLQVYSNLFSKSLPDSITSLTKLRDLFLYTNGFTGKVELLRELNITLLDIHENYFSGSIPIRKSDLIDIIEFGVSKNQLTGSSPWNPDWKRMIIYQIDHNYLTEGLPAASNQSHLLYFIALNNHLSSTIPSDFLALAKNLYYLDLSMNLVTGSIPVGLGSFRLLNQLYLTSNLLTGTLPDLAGDVLLVILDVSSNLLHGTIPSTLSSMRYLEEIFLADNSLTGELDSFLNATRQQVLANIDVSENEFSGTIPVELFTSSLSLQTFSASSNCLEGSIPSEICGTESLISLALDGLTTSNGCKEYLFKDIPYFDGFTVIHFLQGTIPSCLYEMPNLELLHLSGNGLSGSIPNDLNISTILTDLALSHNALSGTIPIEIQHHSWQNLDLSYNKLSGTLSSSFASALSDDDNGAPGPGGSIVLEINRLSGNIPTSLIDSDNLNILEGNIFSCNVLYTDLPRSDPNYNNYSCGSDSANYVLYVWIGLFVCIPFVLLLMSRLAVTVRESRRSSMIELGTSLLDYLKKWKAALRSEATNVNLPRLSIYFSEIRRGTLKLALYCTVILIPLFSLLKSDYSSYTIEYAWSISAMLMNGEIATIVIFLGLICFAVLFLVILKQIIARLTIPKERPNSEHLQYSKEEKEKEKGKDFEKSIVSDKLGDIVIIYSVVSVINLIVMAVADFSYVYTVINYNSVIATLAAFGLALFRLLTNNIILWRALPETAKGLVWLKRKIKKNLESGIKTPLEQHAHLLEYTARDISFLENLMLINNIIIPVIAIIFILRDCFYNALFAANNVQSTYSYKSCDQYLPIIDQERLCRNFTNSDQYSPPFIYSYQCSSKIVINYVPVYVLMFILVGIVIPLLKLFLKLLYDRLPKENESLKGKLRIIIESLLPEYFKEFRNKTNRIRGSEIPRSTLSSALSVSLFGKGQARLFPKLSVSVQINSYLTILVCFGALFPPLAIIAAMTICSITYYEELWIGWLLTETRQLGIDYVWYEEQIEKECKGIEESSNLTIWSTLFVSCSLYGYIIFDTMGDRTGWEAALPMTLLMVISPILILIGVKIHEQFHSSPSVSPTESLKSSIATDDATVVETNNPLRLSNIQLIPSDRFSLSKSQN